MRVSWKAAVLDAVDRGGEVLVGPVLIRGAGECFGADLFGDGGEVVPWVVIFPGPYLDVSDFSFQGR